MNYLKRSLKFTFLFTVSVLVSCVSSALDGVTVVDTDLSVGIELEENIQPVMTVSSFEQPPSDSSEKVTVNQLNWISPEMIELHPEKILPVVELREIVPEIPSVIFSPKKLNDISVVIIPQSIMEEPRVADPSVSVSTFSQTTFEGTDTSVTNVELNESTEFQIVTERELTAFTGTELDITLSGKGWTYLPGENSSGIEYAGRHFVSDNTVYTFFPNREGVELLNFQYQDLGNNIFRKEIVTLTVITEDEGLLLEEPLSGGISEENKEEAISLVRQVEKYLSDNNTGGLSSVFSDILKTELSDVTALFPEIAERLYKGSFYQESALLLEKILLRNGYDSSSDYYLFLLGRIYETETPLRDERISAAYYKQLIDEYPGSFYWEESQNRYRFLKRRYIDIR